VAEDPETAGFRYGDRSGIPDIRILPGGTDMTGSNREPRGKTGRQGALLPALAGAIVLAVLLIAPAAAAVTGKIAFASYPTGWEIYIMNQDGSGLSRLTNNTVNDYDPAWSPNGTKIAFSSRRDGNDEIYVMNRDGSDQTRLTDDPAWDQDPDWSPNGTRIAFESTRDGGRTQIFVMDADGSNVTRLTLPSDGWDINPSWSPNGTKIAFTSSRDGYYNMGIVPI
jgi:Tol biopolymer transport system component